MYIKMFQASAEENILAVPCDWPNMVKRRLPYKNVGRRGALESRLEETLGMNLLLDGF